MYVGGCKCIPPSWGGGGGGQTQWMYFDVLKYVYEGDGVKGIIPRNIFKVILADFHSILYKM